MENFVNILTEVDPDINHFHPNFNFEIHSIDSFKNKQDIDNRSLKIIHHNARSLMSLNRIDEYDIFFKKVKNPFDILIFTETWLTPNKTELCKFDGFQSFHLYRPTDNHIDFKTRGGGISMFIKENLVFKPRRDLNIILPFMECSFIEIHLNNQQYLIGGIYRIPKTNIYSFIDQLNRLLEPLRSTYKLILLGDYNIDLKKDDNYKNDFEMCLQSNYLMPTIFSPTRVATRLLNEQEIISKTLIDNIFINHNMQYQSGIIETTITDHYAIYITIPEMIKTAQIEPKTIQYRVINYMSQRNFNHLLVQSGILEVLLINDGAMAFTQFQNIFEKSYNEAFPLKTKKITIKEEQKPWVNEILINRMKIRDKLNKLANKKRIDRKIFTDFCNQLTSQLRQAKTKYFEEQFEIYENNIKKTWDIINSVIKSKKSQSNVSLSDEDGNYYDKSTIPNKFVDHYTSIASQLT